VPANAAKRLTQHYVDNFRRLPWRSAPGGAPPDPYRVWLSEIMLQQTSVAAVTPRFERFLARWPTLGDLALAPDEDILSEWAGLGYYARARNLVACARIVAAAGGFPRTAAELRKLPGIGEYTASAIAGIAFGESDVAVDTNVQRVISRLHSLEDPAPGEVARLAQAMLEGAHAGDFTQALMDLGATICRPRNPDCRACPLRGDCRAFASGDPERFPRRERRRDRPCKYGIAYWIESDGQVWLERRPPRGLLGGMAALPGSPWSDRPMPPSAQPLGTVRHAFTHFTLELTIERQDGPLEEGWWQRLDTLGEAGLPTLYRRCGDLVLHSGVQARAAA
jgi:A/G-specific adenine glycosylase